MSEKKLVVVSGTTVINTTALRPYFRDDRRVDVVVVKDGEEALAVGRALAADGVTVSLSAGHMYLNLRHAEGGYCSVALRVGGCHIRDVEDKHAVYGSGLIHVDNYPRCASVTVFRDPDTGPRQAAKPPELVARLLPHRGANPFSSAGFKDLWDYPPGATGAEMRRDKLKCHLNGNRLVDLVSAHTKEEALAIARALALPGVTIGYETAGWSENPYITFADTHGMTSARVEVVLGLAVMGFVNTNTNFIVRGKYVVSSVLRAKYGLAADNAGYVHNDRINSCASFTEVTFEPEEIPEAVPVPTQEDEDDDDTEPYAENVGFDELCAVMDDVRTQLASLVVAVSALKPKEKPIEYKRGDKVWVQRTPTVAYEGEVDQTDERYGVYLVRMDDVCTSSWVAPTRMRPRE